MGNSFDFELKANEQVSASIARIEAAARQLEPVLDDARDKLKLGGDTSRQELDELGGKFEKLSRHARDGVQFVGDLVPPLKMVGGLTLGLGGAATVINVVKNNLKEFADYGYRIDTTAKNVSMTAHAFQELTGAMIENGSTREASEGAINDLFTKATDGLWGDNNAFKSNLMQMGIDIHKTKEGLADVGRLADDLNRVLQSMPPGLQALYINKLGLSPELLSLFRNSADEVQRLKDQAQRDGLILSDKEIQNAVAFKQQLNQIGARFDGLILKSQALLGGSGESPAAKALKESKKYEKDSENNFYHGDKQQDILHRARRDEEFKNSLTFKEGLELALGRPGDILQDKLNRKYSESWQSQHEKIINPTDRALGNTPEQKHLSTLEAKHKLPSGILDNVWDAESSRGKNLLSPKGAQGPFQFMPATGRDYGLNSSGDRMDFHKSSEAAARYLSDLLKMFDGDVKKALAAYNWGPGRVRDYGLGRAPKETRDYLHKTMTGLPSYFYQQDGDLEMDGSVNRNSSSIFSNQSSQGNSDVSDASKDLISALSTLNQTLQDGPMQIEISMIDNKTGERRTLSSGNGGRITTPLQFS
ncbi:lytic transglycosylase domain-containing protein [Pectobacterium polaris]|uniref:lytic transglycosylase domain-containing protein n=1 Tax=Pectobacterium polaris TaxID=2042057 RepID=UPI0023AFAA5F|nr:lytic transglycosylase domain-containing protein [Pectobacterium polaris]MDE8742835.1 lytic transglycosylase domain-containing protein [Pectobacterium polaris]